MNLTYTLRLDRSILNPDELDTLFSEVEDSINDDKVEPHNMAFGSVDYRVLDQPPKVALFRRFGFKTGNSPLTFSLAFGGYYVVNESIVVHTASHLAGAPNRDVPDQGSVHVMAIINAVDVANSNLVTRACLGLSQDGGATWSPLQVQTSRPLGYTCGRALRSYAMPYQRHYMDETILNYRPFNLNFDKAVVLLGTFGGDTSNSMGGLGSSPNRYAVMFDNTTTGPANPVEDLIKGAIFLNARERGF